MKLLTLEINRLFNHSRREIEFDESSTAFTGLNGSGKTGALMALRWCLTGDFGAGVTAERAMQQGATDEQSSVVLTMQVGEHRATLTRTLNSASRKLVVGTETITSDAKIKERISAWLGMPVQVAADHLFVAQGELTSFFRMTGAEQAKALQRLFGLDRAEICCRSIGKRLTRNDSVLTASAADLQKRIEGRELERQLLTTQRDALNYSQAVEGKRAATYREAFKVYERFDVAQGERTRLVGREAVLTQQYQTAEADLVKAEAEFAECEEVLAAIDQPSLLMRKQAHEERNKRLPQIAKAQERLNGTRQWLQNLLNSPKPQVLWDDERQAQLSEARHQVRVCQDFLSTFNDGVAECPTCHTPVASLTRNVEEMTNGLAYYEQVVRKLDREHADHAEGLHYQAEVKDIQTRLATDEQTLAALTEALPEKPDQVLPDVLNSLNMAAELTALMKQNRNNIRQRQQQQSQLSGTLAEIAKTITKTDEQLAADRVQLAAAVSREAISNWLREHETRSQLYQNLSGQMLALDKCLTDDRHDLERAERLEAEAATAQEWRGDLTALRELLHHEQLPKKVSARNLLLMENGLNQRLQELGADFTVTVGSDASLSAVFDDGHGGPVSQYLSGGQLAVLGLAMHLELARGLLVLDEPTYGLDESRLDCLRDAFDALRQSSGSSGLQIVVVTHVRSLLPSFGRVVEFGVE